MFHLFSLLITFFDMMGGQLKDHRGPQSGARELERQPRTHSPTISCFAAPSGKIMLKRVLICGILSQNRKELFAVNISVTSQDCLPSNVIDDHILACGGFLSSLFNPSQNNCPAVICWQLWMHLTNFIVLSFDVLSHVGHLWTSARRDN